ncbi:MAG: hypothetical protein ACI9MR_003321 [Myxococcota bacterium]
MVQRHCASIQGTREHLEGLIAPLQWPIGWGYMSDEHEDKRAQQRGTMVGWPILFSVSGDESEMVPSQIYDSTATGAFLACEESEALAVSIGEPVHLYGKLWGTAFVLAATVRWVGRSTTHECHGFGVKFDSTPSLFRLLNSVPRIERSCADAA